MKRIWILAALFAASLASAQTTTTYTGTIKDLTGSTVTSGKITWTLNAPSGGNIPGTGAFVSTTVSCSINASGAPVSSSDGVSPCVITNNTSLTPTGTSYTLCIQPYFVTPGSCYTTFAAGGSVNISTLVPTPATQPNYGVASTTVANTWNQPQTFGTATVGTLNSVVSACSQAGATADLQLSAAISAVSSGGTVDARCYGATTQTLAATITVPAKTSILFDQATHFQAGSVGLNLFIVEPDGRVNGFTFDCTNFPAYSGNLFQTDPVQAYGNGSSTLLENISTTNSCVNNTTGTADKIYANSGGGVLEYTRRHWRIMGFANGELFTSTGTGFVNGTQAEDMLFNNAVAGWHFTNAGSQLNANVCHSCTHETNVIGSGRNGILFDGTATGSDQASGNQWIGNFFDASTAVVYPNNSVVVRNLVIAGWSDGTINDPGHHNELFYISQGVLNWSNTAQFYAGVAIGSNAADNIAGDGTNIYLNSAGNTYLNTANNAYVTLAGAVVGTSFQVGANTVIPSGTTGVHGNGVKIQYSDNTGSSGNLAKFDANGNVTDGGGTATATGTGNLVRASAMPLSGTSGSIGGSALTAGQCASGTVTISGVTAGMPGHAAATDGTYQAGFTVQALGTGANTATVEVCAIVAGTPTAKTYNVRIIQ